MKYVLGALAFILAIGFIGFLFPALLGVAIGIFLIQDGHILGGIIAIIVGILANIVMLVGSNLEGGGSSGSIDHDCPYCGNGDTDGNHCFNCDEEY